MSGHGVMKSLWSIALGLVVAVALVGLLARARAPHPARALPRPPAVPQTATTVTPPAAADEPAEPTLPPDQTKTQELLRANANLESDPDLALQYREIDARYFSRGLPSVSIRWEPRLEDVGPLIADQFRLEGVTDGRLILLNPAIRSDESELRRALCHEIVHVAVWNQDHGHGPVFQRFLRDLASQGAFTGVVASDEEKQALRSTLDSRSAALKADADALLRARTEIDAADVAVRAEADDLNARMTAANQRQRDWPSESERVSVRRKQTELQERATVHNARVRQFNAAVAEFNRLVERYNLMIAYPDGLDRERVERRPPIAEAGR